MANERALPLDEQGNVDFTPLHKLTVKRTGKQIMRLQMGIRITAVIVLALFLIVLLLYLFSLFSTQGGRFTVSTPDGDRGLILSEIKDFSEYTAFLHADPYENMDNISYSWIKEKPHEHEGGSHNGRNYLAYTFYVKNTGKEDIDYRAYILIENVKLAVDEAVRVKLYKNDEETVYAKRTKEGDVQVDTITYVATETEDRKQVTYDTTPFVDAVTICDFDREDFVVDEIDKYTVLIWLEGEDPECIDDIIGGELKMSMFFEVIDEDEAASV